MSTTEQPNVNKILKEIQRLNLARQDFLGVKAFAESLIVQAVDPLEWIYRPQMAGIVTTYARSFGENEGIGPLGKAFRIFDDQSLEDTHDKLLRLRHKMYAHRDSSSVGSFTSADSRGNKSYQLRIRFDERANISLCSNAPELNPENLPNIVKLCALQSQRANDAVMKMLLLLMKGKEYPPGIYTAGADFP